MARSGTRHITIQQDGALPHIKQSNPAFLATATARNWEIKLLTQPVQSPDTNLLDLSFFRALQLLQWDHGFANKINGLIVQVTRAYRDFSPQKVDLGFLTLQSSLHDGYSSPMVAIPIKSPTWGRSDFSETAFSHFTFAQV
jgi:hypothetical protein